MDTSATSDDPLAGVHQTGLSFPDYVPGSSNSFDVTAFTSQDLNLSSSGQPTNTEQEQESEIVKSEGAA